MTQGFSISLWGYCEGNKDKDLGGGDDRMGLVRKEWLCRLNPPDWKPRFRAPKKKIAYTGHPLRVSEFECNSEAYERDWSVERLKELNKWF